MKKLFQWVGLFSCILLSAYACNWAYQNFTNVIEKVLMGIGVIASIVLIIRIVFGKNWLLQMGKEFFIGEDLTKATERFFSDLPNSEDNSTANLVRHLISRMTRLGVIILVLVCITIGLLYNQNQLIDSQTKVFEKRTEWIAEQAYLKEGDRRSSTTHLFSNVMDAIDKELKEDANDKDKRDFSSQLVGRITRLSRKLEAYQYLKGDTLIAEAISPERGQLLISLEDRDLDSLFFTELVSRLILEQADLGEAKLKEIDLRWTNFKRANLVKADLRNAYLKGADFSGASLNEADLSGANLRIANLRGANLIGTNLVKAILNRGYLVGANLTGANLSGVNFRGADLIGANLIGADFKGADLTRADLSRSYAIEADFRGADLTETDFTKAKLAGAYFDSSNIDELFSNTLISKVYRYEKENNVYKIKKKE